MVVVREKQQLRKSNIYVPEITRSSFFGIVCATGPGVKNKTISQGLMVACDRNTLIKTPIENVYIFHDHDIFAGYLKGKWRPIGWKVAIKRDIEEEITPGGIIIPACYQTKDQSLYGHIDCKGYIDNEEIDYPVECGDSVKLRKWDQRITELSIYAPDGKTDYILIAPVSTLDCKIEHGL